MNKPQIVPANAEMVRRHFGHNAPVTVRAIAAVEGDKVLGIAGIYMDEARQIVFGSFTDELRAKPKLMLRAWKDHLRKMLAASGIKAHAVADDSIEASRRFLEHLGFEHIEKGIYECRLTR